MVTGHHKLESLDPIIECTSVQGYFLQSACSESKTKTRQFRQANQSHRDPARVLDRIANERVSVGGE